MPEIVATPDDGGWRQLTSATCLAYDTVSDRRSTAALSGGRIYCRNHPGETVCLDVRGK